MSFMRTPYASARADTFRPPAQPWESILDSIQAPINPPLPVARGEGETRLIPERLMKWLRLRREAGSLGCSYGIEKYLDTKPGMQRDAIGNRWLIVGSSPPRIMFSAHTDTVHSGDKGVMFQRLKLTDNGANVSLARESKTRGNVLGADDAAGLYILESMIAAGVPGFYLFPWCEEKGGQGSAAFVRGLKKDKELRAIVESCQACIAFDRKDMSDIITHQGGTRTASDAFAESLASILKADSFLKPSRGGTFTDSKNFIDHIGECSNVSCGYSGAHTAEESLYLDWLLFLTRQCIGADWSKLVIERKPGESEPTKVYASSQTTWIGGGYYSGGYGGGRTGTFRDYGDSDLWEGYDGYGSGGVYRGDSSRNASASSRASTSAKGASPAVNVSDIAAARKNREAKRAARTEKYQRLAAMVYAAPGVAAVQLLVHSQMSKLLKPSEVTLEGAGIGAKLLKELAERYESRVQARSMHAAKLLHDCGFTADDFAEFYYQASGRILNA